MTPMLVRNHLIIKRFREIALHFSLVAAVVLYKSYID